MNQTEDYIKDTREIKVGDTLQLVKYGKGNRPLDIGYEWEMKDKNTVIYAAISIIEDGFLWKKKEAAK